jgi:outer membrane protein assembly factor BamE (lipoprotein component of BamABCDE complex)
MGRFYRYFNRARRAVPRNCRDRVFGVLAIAAILVAAGLAGCAPDIEKRGDLPETDALAQVRPGTTTRAEIVKLLGSPSSTGVFDPNTWYYISKETKQISFFDPSILDQQVYVINFDGNGVVSNVEHKTLKDARNIPMAPGATPAPGRELTFMEQLVGNLGRFNGSSNEAQGSSNTGIYNGGRETNQIGF